MNRKERARQFLPFASLRGFDEYLAEMTREKEEKREITEDRGNLLSKKIKEIHKGDLAEVVFYENDHYETWKGTVQEVDLIHRKLKVEEKTIPFDDIWDIKSFLKTGEE